MTTDTFERRTPIAAPPGDVFDWHTREGAFDRLTPPWENVRVIEPGRGVADGSRVALQVKTGPLRQRWVARHEDVRPSEGFVDVQEEGPFAAWKHHHRMVADGPDRSWLEDRIEYGLPFGPLGRLFGRGFVERKLERLFRYRHGITREDLAAHRSAGARPMKIVVTGASGLVGRSLVPFLTTGGHEVRRLVRTRPVAEARDASEAFWDPETGSLDTSALEGVDAVIHLAGENIASGRWTAAKKERIRRSRVEGTALLARAIAACERPPEVLVSASAVGFYGDRGDEELDEASAPGAGFLPDVCREWETATAPAQERGVRVVTLRIGVVLTPAGGALRKMLPPFLMGAGGRLGHGGQFMSWIALDDLVYAIQHAVTKTSLYGPVNAVSPEPVSNGDFTKALGRVLRRPTLFPVPGPMARLAFGQLADDLLLASARVLPSKLIESGFTFRYPGVESALRHVLGRKEATNREETA